MNTNPATLLRAVGTVSRDTSLADMGPELPEGTQLTTLAQAEAYAKAMAYDALKQALAIAEQQARVGVMRSLEATYKADAAREIATGISKLMAQLPNQERAA